MKGNRDIAKIKGDNRNENKVKDETTTKTEKHEKYSTETLFRLSLTSYGSVEIKETPKVYLRNLL